MSKELHLFKIEIFCYIINILTVTFDQFNVSLQNIIFFFWTAVFKALMSGGYVAHCGVLGVKLPV